MVDVVDVDDVEVDVEDVDVDVEVGAIVVVEVGAIVVVVVCISAIWLNIFYNQ